jgi:hypothetical protein
MPRRLFPILCTALLLIAQYSAQSHALWHAGNEAQCAAGIAQAQPTGGEGRSSGSGDQGKLCAFDLAFGQVLGGAHGACVPLLFIPAAAERIDLPAARAPHAAAVTPKSRGPPPLL